MQIQQDYYDDMLIATSCIYINSHAQKLCAYMAYAPKKAHI